MQLLPLRRQCAVCNTSRLGASQYEITQAGIKIKRGAVVSGAVVSGAVVSGVVVSGVVSGAVVSVAVVSRAAVSGAVVSGAVVSGAVVTPLRCSPGKSAALQRRSCQSFFHSWQRDRKIESRSSTSLLH